MLTPRSDAWVDTIDVGHLAHHFELRSLVFRQIEVEGLKVCIYIYVPELGNN